MEFHRKLNYFVGHDPRQRLDIIKKKHFFPITEQKKPKKKGDIYLLI